MNLAFLTGGGAPLRKNVVCIWIPITFLLVCQFLLLSQPTKLNGSEDVHFRDSFVTGRKNRTAVNKSQSVEELVSSSEGKAFVASIKRTGPIRGVKKERLNYSCSLPYKLAPEVKPVPFNDRDLLVNTTHITCSMGCMNATFPINVPSFLIVSEVHAIQWFQVIGITDVLTFMYSRCATFEDWNAKGRDLSPLQLLQQPSQGPPIDDF